MTVQYLGDPTSKFVINEDQPFSPVLFVDPYRKLGEYPKQVFWYEIDGVTWTCIVSAWLHPLCSRAAAEAVARASGRVLITYNQLDKFIENARRRRSGSPEFDAASVQLSIALSDLESCERHYTNSIFARRYVLRDVVKRLQSIGMPAKGGRLARAASGRARPCQSVTYFIQHAGDPRSPIKIGRAKSLKHRMISVRDFPLGIRLLGYFDSDVEYAVHEKFSYHLLNAPGGGTEWFACSVEILSFIADLAIVEEEGCRFIVESMMAVTNQLDGEIIRRAVRRAVMTRRLTGHHADRQDLCRAIKGHSVASFVA